MGQFRFILWVAYWYSQSESFEFQWDAGNSEKSEKKHGVAIEDVESLFELQMGVPLGRQVSPATEEERLCIVGPVSSGKMVSVVFTLREGKVRPISSRLASRKERKLYEEVRKIT
jgi:uncharacterized protein